MAKSKFYLVSNFLSGIGAAHNLLADAIQSRRLFIEQICLAATLIDGLLRLSLVMKQQLDMGTDIVDPMLLFQSKRQKKFKTENRFTQWLCTKKLSQKQLKKSLGFYIIREILLFTAI